MTDAPLIAKKLATIESCVRELRTLARLDQLHTDVREERFVEHTLQMAIQAALDAASHIVSDDRLGEPDSYRELFDILARTGWVNASRAAGLRQMAGFRNILVHAYQDVDLELVRSVVENHLGDLLEFVDTVRAKLAAR